MAKDITISIYLRDGPGIIDITPDFTLGSISPQRTETIQQDTVFTASGFGTQSQAELCNIDFSCAGTSGYTFSYATLNGTNSQHNSDFSVNLGPYYNGGSLAVTIYFEESSSGGGETGGGGTGGSSDNEFYYKCYEIQSERIYNPLTEEEIVTNEGIIRPDLTGYKYLGYVYHSSYENCLDQVSENTGNDRFDGTDDTCYPPSSGKYPYIIFFYEKSGWYCDSIQDLGTISDTQSIYPEPSGIFTNSGQIRGYSLKPAKDGYLAILTVGSENYQTWLSIGLNIVNRPEAIRSNATTASDAIDTGYLSYNTITSGFADPPLGFRVIANNITYGYFSHKNLNSSGSITPKFEYLADKILTYYANDGTSKSTTGNLMMDSRNGVLSLQLPSNSYFTRSGYTLTGWNTAANGSGTSYNCGQTLTNIASDLTLYAQWKINKYTVRFCNNSGTTLSTVTCDPGSSITMASATTAPAVNVEQLGWSTTNSSNYRNYNINLKTGEYACGATYTPTTSLTTFFPIWRYRKQNVFYKDGTTIYLAASQNMGIQKTFKITSSPFNKTISPTENGKFPFAKIVGNRTKNMRYRFTGWSLNENDKKPVYQAGDDITLPNSTNLYDKTIYLYSVRQPYFYFQDAKGNNLIDAYNGPIKDFITTSQMEELRGYLNDYGISLNISDHLGSSSGNIENFTSMLPNSKIKLSDYNLLGSKVENTKFTAKDFYELQQAFNSAHEDELEPWYLQPLTFTPVNASDTITMTIKKIGDFTSSGSTSYRTKFSNETSHTAWSNFPTQSFTLTNKTSLSIAATSSATKLSVDNSNYYQFEITGGPVIVTGSVLSLLRQPVDYQLPDYCFYNLFKGCTNIITAPELPSLKIGAGSYQGMFQGCTGLTIPPSLPATTLGSNCYSNMFQGCTSLKVAPNLPATTLTSNCYSVMFKDCTSLKVAPKLPAAALENNSYLYMFFNCSSLKDAPLIGATTLNGTNEFGAMFNHCTNLKHIKLAYTGNFSNSHFSGWVNDVASNGILEYNGEDTTVGVNAIPSGWAVQKST